MAEKKVEEIKNKELEISEAPTAKKENKAGAKPKTKAAKATPKSNNTKPKSEDMSEPARSEVEPVSTDTEPTSNTVAVAKAGKRSAKAIAEKEQAVAKEERKKSSTSTEAPKSTHKPARTRLERQGKKLQEAYKLIKKGQEYTLAQAMDLAEKTSPTKFDASVELHIRLSVDPKQADQNIRDTVVLPNGTGKTLRVAVFAEETDCEKATKAGADIAGVEAVISALDKSLIEFDVLISTPALMAKLGKYARVLGPKGLMPNPKSGTVTADVAKAVREAKAGKVEYRVDSTGIVHSPIGKVSFGAKKLTENSAALLASIKSNKPSGIKGSFVRSIYASTAMGPGIKISASEM